MRTRYMTATMVAIVLALAQVGLAGVAAAQLRLLPAYGNGALAGPRVAAGAVVWSHGRSVEVEDSEAPTPAYLRSLRRAGWDVFRFDRMRVSDTLPNSSRALADHADTLKGRGYRQVVLTGQSFGAFVSLLAAARTDSIDAVIGTAPAAFGSFTESFESYRENASYLYSLLEGVRRARVALFFFHGDDFDPGGRGERSSSILAARGLANIVVDQPAALVGHGAAASGLFVRRFAGCIIRFAERAPRSDDPPCDESWGAVPSTDLLTTDLLAGGLPRSGGSAAAQGPLRAFAGTWYGSYVNGREVIVSIAPATNGRTTAEAEYVLGPGVDPDQGPERVRRTGRLEGDELVFDEPGRNVLRYRLRRDGRLAGTWAERSGPARLDTVLRRVDQAS